MLTKLLQCFIIFREKIVIPETLPFITFSGDAMNRTVITWNDSYSTIGSDGHPLKTFNSASVAVNADYFVAINIVFEVLKNKLALYIFFSLRYNYISSFLLTVKKVT